MYPFRKPGAYFCWQFADLELEQHLENDVVSQVPEHVRTEKNACRNGLGPSGLTFLHYRNYGLLIGAEAEVKIPIVWINQDG